MTKFFQIFPQHDKRANTAALIANGALHNYSFFKTQIESYHMIIAVDGGAAHCHKMELTPDFLIGDLDSIPPELTEKFSEKRIKRFASEKDETDLELAIQFTFQQGIERIGIFGALEKRTDHALYNLHLLQRFPRKVFFETEYETIFALDGANEVHCTPGQTISLIPLGPSPHGVTTKGLKWELSHATLDKNFMSISNVCQTSLIQVEIENGDLICCLSKG